MLVKLLEQCLGKGSGYYKHCHHYLNIFINLFSPFFMGPTAPSDPGLKLKASL